MCTCHLSDTREPISIYRIVCLCNLNLSYLVPTNLKTCHWESPYRYYAYFYLQTLVSSSSLNQYDVQTELRLCALY